MQRDEEISRQRVVMPAEMEQLLTNGWKYLGILPSGKVVIEK